MSKYNNTKFFWLQLKEDFFEEDSIEWLEEQANGKEYSLFYLKLCLKSLKTNGVLIRNVGEMLVPYDNEKLAEMTKTNVDTVTVAMALLQKIGLVKILNNGEIYLSQIINMVGSQSISAFKKQQQRMIGGQLSTNCPPNLNLELEDRLIDINNNIYTQLEKIELVQNLTDKYNIIFISKGIYITENIQIPDILFLQIKLYQGTIRELIDSQQNEILSKIDILILEKVWGQVVKAKIVNGIVNYFKAALLNEFIKKE